MMRWLEKSNFSRAHALVVNVRRGQGFSRRKLWETWKGGHAHTGQGQLTPTS